MEDNQLAADAISSRPIGLVAVLLAIALIRALPLAFWYDDLRSDPDAYASIAVGYASSGTFGGLPPTAAAADEVLPTAFRPPLYPLVLSLLTRHDFSTARPSEPLGDLRLSIPAVAALHWVLGVATSVLAIQIAGACLGRAAETLSPRRIRALSYAAGLLVAVDPILLRQSSVVMTETLATFLAVAFWAWWCRGGLEVSRWSGLGGGVLLGLSVLCRPTAAAWIALMAAWLLCKKGTPVFSRGGKKNLRLHFQLMMGLLLTVSPWVVRNWIQFGKPIWATTHGGYTLLLANNPVLFDHFRRGHWSRDWDEARFHAIWAQRYGRDLSEPAAWQVEPAATLPVPAPVDEIAEDRYARDAAVAAIAAEPGIFAKASLTRLGWLWAWWPDSRQAGRTLRLLIGTWYGCVLCGLAIATAWAWFRQRFRHDFWALVMPGVALILAVSAVHAVYWSNMRMRSVAMPAVYILLVSLLAIRANRGRSRNDV